MWDIKTIIKDFFKTRNFQEFINHRYKDTFLRTPARYTYKFIGTNYAMFHLDDMVGTIESSDVDYKTFDLRQTDIVLDIGACIGGFSLKVYKNVQHVYAVEPIVTTQLEKNIQLNNAKNITVFDYSLGKVERQWNGNEYKCSNDNEQNIKNKTLSELITLCGGQVDFLKCDCEGGEWFIKPDELKNIRRIEMEVHHLNKNMPKLEIFEKILIDAGFEYQKKIFYTTMTMLIHAHNPKIRQKKWNEV